MDKGMLGMACRDPETGVRWRLYATDPVEPYYTQWVNERGERSALGAHWGPLASHAEHNPSLVRAYAAGPDLTDELTAAGYAIIHRWHLVPCNDLEWLVCKTFDTHGHYDQADRYLGATVSEAVQKAVQGPPAKGTTP